MRNTSKGYESGTFNISTRIHVHMVYRQTYGSLYTIRAIPNSSCLYRIRDLYIACEAQYGAKGVPRGQPRRLAYIKD